MKDKQKEKLLSNCCNAPAELDFSDDFTEGDSEHNDGCTCCYMCTKCGKPCDVVINKEDDKQ